MKILLITPGINKDYNDNYYAYKAMVDGGHQIVAISNKENINKGGRSQLDSSLDLDGDFKIFRIFDSFNDQHSFAKRRRYSQQISQVISDFSPDVIFCEEISNFFFALEVKRKWDVPIVLRTEFIFDSSQPYRNMGRFLSRFKNPLSRDLVPKALGWLIWRFVYAQSAAVVSCYFEDAVREPAIYGTPFCYIPWPTKLRPLSAQSFERNRAVFIGAFDAHKNLGELLDTVPKLLSETPIEEFVVVGTGANAWVIDSLMERFPGAVRHVQSLSRDDCLNLIASSFISVSPATRGGWGFIGDSWAVGTPVVVTHNHYHFNDGVDVVLTSPEEIAHRVNELYECDDRYEKLRAGGKSRFDEKHTAEAVGRAFLKVCQATIS